MRLAFLVSLLSLSSLNTMEKAIASGDEAQRRVCGEVDAYYPERVRLVRRAIYQPGTNGGYFGTGRTYRIVGENSETLMSNLRKYHGRHVCVLGYDFSQANDWAISITSIIE